METNERYFRQDIWWQSEISMMCDILGSNIDEYQHFGENCCLHLQAG
jgi:hypothetical protein